MDFILLQCAQREADGSSIGRMGASVKQQLPAIEIVAHGMRLEAGLQVHAVLLRTRKRHQSDAEPTTVYSTYQSTLSK